jgi:hypothetical protein
MKAAGIIIIFFSQCYFLGTQRSERQKSFILIANNCHKLAKCCKQATSLPCHSLTHGAEPFLRSHQLCSYSRTSQHFREPKVHYCIHKNPPPVRILSRSIQSIPSHPISLRSILILSTYLHLGFPSGLFPSGFPTNIIYAFLFSPIRAIGPSHLILLDLITLIMPSVNDK